MVISALDTGSKSRFIKFTDNINLGMGTNGYCMPWNTLLEPEVKRNMYALYTCQHILPYCDPNGKDNNNSIVNNTTVHRKLELG